MCRGRPAPALPFRITVPGAQLQTGVGSRQGSKLTSRPSLPHPSQQSRDDKRGPYVPVVQCGSDDLASVTLQPVLKRRLGEGTVRRPGREGAASTRNNFWFVPPKHDVGRKKLVIFRKQNTSETRLGMCFSFLFFSSLLSFFSV